MITEKFKLLVLFCLLISIQSLANGNHLYIGEHSKISEIALEKLDANLDYTQHGLNEFDKRLDGERIVLLNIANDSEWIRKHKLTIGEIKPEGYQLLKQKEDIYIVGGDERGLMYGILDLRDHLKYGKQLASLEPKLENPHFPFRAIKFNLPWSSYRVGESLQLHYQTVRDTTFWEPFLDMMVDNRFNALTLWNLHPFTFMIQPEGFPEAIQYTGGEFAEWQKFWRTLFRMAKERGIETYILNWNIITSPGLTEAHNVANYKDDLEWHFGYTPADTSKIIIDYMRQCITQTINEYPDLTGVGVSVGERMKMPINDAMEWIKQTYVEGIKQANRKVKFIHRAPFSVSPVEAREYIESYTDIPNLELPIIMEFKFNWSHGHSSPYLSITHGGKVADQYWNPKPKNYQMGWMMRNEDFLMLNWGNADFIREHIKVNDFEGITCGYFVGSETYIPAKEYRMAPETEYNWKYAFEKQWEFYKLWGRLLYDPETPNSCFTDEISLRYGAPVAGKMFDALQLASEMPLEFASFYQGTWDFTIYCESFLNGKQLYRNYREADDAFISVTEMISHPVLDHRYLNVDEFVNQKLSGKAITEEQITPLEVAHKMQQNAQTILQLCSEMEQLPVNDKANFNIELNDLKTWAFLSNYFAEKLLGAVALDEAVKTKNEQLQQDAITHLRKGAEHWQALIKSTEQYNEVTLLHIRNFKFHWKYFYPRVLKDIEIAEGAEVSSR